MKLWIDDARPAPHGYLWARSVNEAIQIIDAFAVASCAISPAFSDRFCITLIDIDHDSGDFYSEGGDYIEVLKYLESCKNNYPIKIHSMNPVGVSNMRAIIQKNGWREVR